MHVQESLPLQIAAARRQAACPTSPLQQMRIGYDKLVKTRRRLKNEDTILWI